jgi:pyruvate/2-oxoglutarate dehydrogenase complex dihydrolipoamide dehydrogenase (E3) component
VQPGEELSDDVARLVVKSAGVGAGTASRAIVVATGTAPAAPPIPGLVETPYWPVI